MPEALQHLNVNGISIAYDTFGDPAAEPLVLIAGLGSQMISWAETFCETLASHGYYVVRFDNRDIGLSTYMESLGVPNAAAYVKAWLEGGVIPKNTPYTLYDMADDVAGLMDALGFAKAYVVGSSLGGMVAQIMAIKHADRVARLGLLMTTSGAPHLPSPTPAAMQALMSKPADESRESYLKHVVGVARTLSGVGAPVDEESVRERAISFLERGLNPPGVARQMVAVIASMGWRDALKQISIPVAVVHGEGDPLFPLACGKDVADCIPASRFTAVKGMGHSLLPTFWDETIQALVAR